MEPLFIWIAFLFIGIGSLTDLKTREVPDYINYLLIFSAIILRLMLSILNNDLKVFIDGVLGLSLMFLLSALLFFTGQWGGGDSKLLIGLGGFFGIEVLELSWNIYLIILISSIIFILNIFPLHNFKKLKNRESLISSIENKLISILSLAGLALAYKNINLTGFLTTFLLNLLIGGGIYSVFWAIFLVIRNFRRFKEEFKSALNKKILLSILLLSLSSFIFGFFIYNNLLKIAVWIGGFFMLLFYLLILGVRSIEKTLMIKEVNPKELTEGDWIVEEVYVKGRYITGPDDLGISQDKINKLKRYYEQGLINKIKIKEGIPFVPSFFFALVLNVAGFNAIAIIKKVFGV